MRKSIHSAQYRVLLEHLVAARESRRVTQAALAKRLHATQSSVSKIERGERRLDIIELHSWCQALNVPFAKFVHDLDVALQK
jgi:transcriptional regulator with XRE-family HTH domain